MLSAIRAFAKSWVAAVLIGLLIVSFAVFGIRDVFGGKISNAVVSAGSRSVSAADFKREFDNYKARFEQQAGQPITAELAAQNGLDRRILEMVASRAALAELMSKLNLHPSQNLVSKSMQSIPAFFDPITGRFDKKQFQQRIGEVGLTPDRFVQLIGDDIAEEHLMKGIMSGVRMPRTYAALAAVYMTESRDLAYFNVDPKSVPQPAAPTDAQLTAFMQENAQALTRPEYRVLTVVRFSPTLAGANLAVDEAELKKRYDFRKDTLSTPETRTLVQIPAKDQAAAAQIMQRLARGESPAAAAKAVGVDAILYENKPLTAVADRRAGAAAFRLPVNQPAVVQGDLGAAVVKVLAITPGKVVTLEEARPMLEAELRKDAAAEKVYAQSQAYDDAHQAGSSLTEAAQKAGVPAVTIGPLSQQGVDLQGRPVPGLTQKLVETAFGLPAGGESEVTEQGNGEYFAVRVEKVLPAALPPLAEVRDRLAVVWMQRQVAKRMEARAEELAARVRKGESLDAVAASTGQGVHRVAGLSRATAGQNQELSQEALALLFNAKPGEVLAARGRQFGFLVGKLEAVHAGEGPTLARMAEAARNQMNVAMFGEMEQAARLAARQKVKVKVDYARARAAIGLEPQEAPKAGKAGLAK